MRRKGDAAMSEGGAMNQDPFGSIRNTWRQDQEYEVERRVLEKWGSVYRIMHYPPSKYTSTETFEVEVAPLNEDGTYDDEWGGIGGFPGMDSATFSTLERATKFLNDVAALDPSDEDDFWALLTRSVAEDVASRR